MRFLLLLCLISLALSQALYSQNNQTTTNQKLLFEKVYLHTDRETYAAGEDIWFSAYLVNAQNNQFSNSSNTLYIELVSSLTGTNKIYDKKIIRLENGFGYADIKLSDSLATGKYQLRAWTNWMRNFSDHFIFDKEITILNAHKKGESQKANQTSLAKAEVQFFPEGGSLVDSVEHVIAFKSTDENGKNLAFIADVIDHTGTLITKIESDKGVGIFSLIPLKNETYTVKGKFINGKTFSSNLPTVLATGLSLHVIQKDSLLQMNIATNNKSSLVGKDALLMIRSHGKTIYKDQFTLTGLQNVVKLNKNNFPEGINTITLYDFEGKPHCERLFFVGKNKVANISLQTDKTSYSIGEKVSLKIKTTDSLNKPTNAILSLAVVDDNLVAANLGNIISYLHLQSEIKGDIENPKQYFDTENPYAAQRLDLLLLTQGWRDYVWRKLSESRINLKYPTENGLSISGKVRQLFADNPIADANISMFINGAKNGTLYAVKSNTNGAYFFDDIHFYGSQAVKLTSVDSKGNKNGWIQMDSVFKTSNFTPTLKTNKSEDATSSQANQMLERLQLKRKYTLKDTINLKEVTVKSNLSLFDDVASEFGYPVESFTVTKDDYDIVNLKSYILYKSKQAIEVENPDSPGITRIMFPYFGKRLEPKIFVNGKQLPIRANDAQEVKDDYYNTYFSLPMSKVKKVMIKHLVGLADGAIQMDSEEIAQVGTKDVFVILLTIDEDALDNKKFNMISEMVDGYYLSRDFYKVNPSENKDYKTTIFWQPHIQTNSDGEAEISFYNSNINTKVRIAVEGLSLSGTPLAKDLIYSVK